jgi:hypothetical protein
VGRVAGRRLAITHKRPIQEPANSTVNDWHGQKVADDMELADELMEETEGDADEAEERFRERSAANDPERDINRPKPS